ncbi:MAG: sugar transferase [Chloroflexi bacterium]|nr:sugar transferase [Chloroflexota bacterium]
MYRKENILLIFLLLLTDALAIAGALVFAFVARYTLEWLPLVERLEPITSRYQVMIPLAIPLWLALFALNRLYDKRYLLVGLEEYRRVVMGCTLGILGVIVVSFIEPNLSISRSWLVLSWISAILFVSAMRFAIRRVIFLLRRRGRFITRAIIVGANEQGKAIARTLSPAAASGIEVVGFADDFLPRDSRVVDDLRVLDRPAALARIAAETGASEAIVVQGAVAWESFMEIITRSASSLNDLTIKFSPGFYEIMATGVHLSYDGVVPLLVLEKNRITGLDALMKNAVDYFVAAFVAVVLSPLLLLLALLVKLATRESVLEGNPVLGRREKIFATWKYRTHRKGQDYSLGVFLYRLGLDKLPQIFNILRGEMSLVGPRPIPVVRASAYQEWLPTLLTVKPGLTGPWVVSGAAADSIDAEIRLDLFYTRNWTIWADAQILLQTVVRLFQGERPRVAR